jgi:hypothetical protein
MSCGVDVTQGFIRISPWATFYKPYGFKKPRQGSIDVSPAQGIPMPPWWVTYYSNNMKPHRGGTRAVGS